MQFMSWTISLLAAGCASRLDDATFATGSQTAVSAGDGTTALVVDADRHELTRVSPGSAETARVELPGEPSRVARAGDRAFVTLRDARSVAVVDLSGDGLSLADTVEVGAEPVGIVAREDGTRLYVALSTVDEVVELDGETLAPLRTFPVAGQPTWIALHPTGSALYVGSAYGGGVSWIDLDGGDVTALALPEIVGAGDDGLRAFLRRVTGDPWVSADGSLLAVPTLHVDKDRDVGAPDTEAPASSGYGSTSGVSLSRFNPAVELVPLQRDGTPKDRDATTALVAASISGDTVRSYVSSVTLSPDATTLYATMEGSDAVVVASTTPVYGDADEDFCCSDTGGGVRVTPTTAGMATLASIVLATDRGPRGVALVGDDLLVVDCWIDRTVGSKQRDTLRERVDEQLVDGFANDVALADRVERADSPLDADVLEGRRMFHTAVDSEMAAPGAGISCATCHLAGRNDGITWPLEAGGRQTPSLAGGIAATAPFTWASDVALVADEVEITSQGRMGGENLDGVEAAEVAAYVETLRAPDLPAPDEDAVARGAEIFAREEVACASCHPAPLYTDNLSWELYGLRANTPTLRRVASTAPYLHEGTAPTLADVLILSRAGGMGDTSSLSDAEMADLEAFLRSL